MKSETGLDGCGFGNMIRSTLGTAAKSEGNLVVKMRYSVHDSESGQSLVEYTLILGTVAVGCVAAAIFLSGGIDGLYGSIGSSADVFNPPNAPASVAPPVQPTVPTQPGVPTKVEDCLDGRWLNYPQFTDEASCVEFVTDDG